MKTIAIFIGGYLPAKNYGGPVTSIANIAENLGKEYNIKIISNNHEFNESKKLSGIHDGWNKIGNAHVIYLYDREYTKKNFVNLLKECDADVLYISSIFYYQMNIPAIRAAKSLGIPVVLAPRGELCANALNIGRVKKKIYLKLLKISGVLKDLYYHTTSQEEYEATRDILHAGEERIWLFPNMPCKPSAMQTIYKEQGEAKFVFISRIQEKKNLLYAIEQIGKLDGNIIFDIYGPIEQKEYWDRCKNAIENTNSNVKISYKGSIAPGTSRQVFAQYHCFVFPTLSENYGHVIAEAISAGCMLAVSRGTTPWDNIAGNGGWVCTLGNDQEWASALNEIISLDNITFNNYKQKLCCYVEEKLEVEKLNNKYKKMFDVTV